MKTYSYSFILANFGLIFFLILPMYDAPIGRVGGEVFIFMFMLPIIFFSIKLKDITTLSPFLFGILSILLTWTSTKQNYDSVLLTDGLIPTLSYSRNLLFGVIGLYLGKNMHPNEMRQFVRNLFFFAILVTIFAIGQANFYFCRWITVKYYTSIPDSSWLIEDNVIKLIQERPKSTLDRTWAYSYFAAVIFLSAISLPTFFKTKFMLYHSIIIFLVGLIYSGTRSAVFSVITGLCLLIFTNAAVLEKKRNLIIKILGTLILFIIPSITYTYGFDRLDWFYNPFIMGISGAAEEIQSSNSFLCRMLYIERQLQIFYEHPIFGRLAAIGWNYTDNLYVSRLAYGGIIGLICTLMVPIAFFILHTKYRNYSKHLNHLSDHLILSNLLFWSAFCGLVMGVAWDFFVANRAMFVFIFIYGLLSGQLINIRSTMNSASKDNHLNY